MDSIVSFQGTDDLCASSLWRCMVVLPILEMDDCTKIFFKYTNPGLRLQIWNAKD
jgi:hypothetical protein